MPTGQLGSINGVLNLLQQKVYRTLLTLTCDVGQPRQTSISKCPIIQGHAITEWLSFIQIKRVT